ncbi:MAG: pyridoxal phosphate-dependent aminotransferase [Phycisphaerae bacterium]
MNGRDFVAERVKGVGSSGIRRAFDLAATLKDPIDLSIGQPDFAVPRNIKQAVIDAVEADHNGYTQTRGLAQLRELISDQLKTEFRWEPDVFVTSGVSGGLFLALLACVNPGEEVLIGDPYFVSYVHLVRLVGGVPVLVDLYDDFQLHPERFEAAVTAKTKLIILSSPGNPTGIVYSENDVRSVAEIARRNDLLIISDEIYCVLTYDGRSPSPVPFAPERTLLLRGYSKTYAMTGLRIGYAAGPGEVITEMAKLQQYTFVCAPHPAQYGAIEAATSDASGRTRWTG